MNAKARVAADLRTLHPAQVALATQALERVLAGSPADRALADVMRGRRNIGARDRRWVSGLVFGCLRCAVALRARCGDDIAGWLGAMLDAEYAADAAALQRLGLPLPPPLSPVLAGEPAHRRNWPEWLNAAAESQMDAGACDRLAAALRIPGGVDLRVNTLRTTPEQAAARLAEEGVTTRRVPWAANLLRVDTRQPLQGTTAWRNGWIEPQDAGSQLICALLDAAPGERVADWCAGAGGKTLAMAASMQRSGALVALDTETARLARLAPRAERLGVTGVQTEAIDPETDQPRRTLDPFDAVLVDAPCSGVGTLRRRPERVLAAVDLAAFNALQRRILTAAATHVRPGGRLVYATCSFLRQENDAVVDAFLAAHDDFTVDPAAGVLGSPPAEAEDPWLRTTPEQHDSDAFCAIRLRRRA